jgi:hypothetical protein
VLAPGYKLLHTVLFAFRDKLYGAVVAVAHPAHQSQTSSLVLCIGAEGDSLDATVHNAMHPCDSHQGCRLPGFSG